MVSSETFNLSLNSEASSLPSRRPLAAGGLERVVELDNRSWAHPSPVMVRWASGLRAAGVRTAILSNMPVTLRAYLDAHALWMPAFDHRTFSCDVRLAKPGPEIFLSCLEGLGATLGDTLFLDDREENIAAARVFGFPADLFRNVQQLRAELDSMGVADSLTPIEFTH